MKTLMLAIRSVIKKYLVSRAYRKLSKMQGTVDLELDIRELRKNKR